MKSLIAIVMLAACGGGEAPVHNEGRNAGPIEVAWVTEPHGFSTVGVSIAVANSAWPLGQLSAVFDDATAFAPTPMKCRVMDDQASPTTTGFICGETRGSVEYFVAAIERNDLVITRHIVVQKSELEQTESHDEIKRIPIAGTSLVVKPYMP
jgi:hypothetical protein